MEKSLKLTFILSLCLAAVAIAFRSVCLFFGVGIAFVIMLGLFAATTYLFVLSGLTRKRALDIYIISAVLLALELIVYFAGEIALAGLNKGMLIYQGVISVLAVFAFVYVTTRLILERNGKGFTFGGQKKEKRVKRANKELSNGSLQDKPSKLNEQSLFENVKEQPIEQPDTDSTAQDAFASAQDKLDDEQTEN